MLFLFYTNLKDRITKSLLRCLLIDICSIQFEKRERERERERERHRDSWYDAMDERALTYKKTYANGKYGIYMLCNGTINIKHMEINY